MSRTRTMLAFLTSAALLPAVAVLAVPPQESQPAVAPPPSQEGMPDMGEIMPKPTPLHGMFDDRTGTWEARIRMWMEPGAPPTEFTGTSTIAFVLGDQYLQEKTHSTFMGMPFEGLGTWGYDARKGEYWHVWLDSFGWPPMKSHGTWDAETRTFTFTSEPYWDTWKQKNVVMRSVIRLESTEHWTYEAFETPEGEKERKSMEIAYRRPMS